MQEWGLRAGRSEIHARGGLTACYTSRIEDQMRRPLRRISFACLFLTGRPPFDNLYPVSVVPEEEISMESRGAEVFLSAAGGGQPRVQAALAGRTRPGYGGIQSAVVPGSTGCDRFPQGFGKRHP